MKQTVNFDTFFSAFQSIRPDNFTYEGLKVLFDYLEDLESDTGTEIDFDVIGICCEYSEDTLVSVLEDYGLDNIEDLRDNTTVLMVDDTQGDVSSRIVYRNY